MKNLLEYIAKNITSEEITIEELEENNLKNYTIVAPQSVFGLLIGKSGKTIRAIRSLARARAIKDNETINIQLKEAEVN